MKKDEIKMFNEIRHELNEIKEMLKEFKHDYLVIKNTVTALNIKVAEKQKKLVI